MRAGRWIVTSIGAVTGVCFAALAARGVAVSVISPHYFRASSLIFAVISACLSYVAFRAATSGRTDHASVLRALWGGTIGALVGLGIVVGAYIMFRQTARAYFAHPLGLHFSQVTPGLLLVVFLCLGFGAGFALRLQSLRQN